MQKIADYNQLPIGNLQQYRLYVQARPLVSLWSRSRRQSQVNYEPWAQLIDQELDQDFVAVDCAGWYFANANRNCTAIEIMPQSSQHWSNIHYEYDYLTWHPTYLQRSIVLAYYSSYFKYCALDDLLTFCEVWGSNHNKIVVGLDPSKIKYNYFKWNLIDLLKQKFPHYGFSILVQEPFDLLFTIKTL